MRIAILAAAMACGLATGASAATYTLVNPVYNQVAQDARASLNFSFTVSDAAVARGTFNLTGTSGFIPSGNSPNYTGDVGDFISFTANETASPTRLIGNLTISARFAAGGDITASSFTYGGLNESSTLTGSSSAFGGVFGSDNFHFLCTGPACTVAGQLAATTTANPVPEPVSLSLIGVGLLSLAGLRRIRPHTARRQVGAHS